MLKVGDVVEVIASNQRQNIGTYAIVNEIIGNTIYIRAKDGRLHSWMGPVFNRNYSTTVEKLRKVEFE